MDEPSYIFGNMAHLFLPGNRKSPDYEGEFKRSAKELNFQSHVPDGLLFSFAGEAAVLGFFMSRFRRLCIMVEQLVGVVMGSVSDWETMKHACDILDELHVPYEKRVVSAHRTPDLMFGYAEAARERGLKVIIAGAGGAAHLPGMIAAKTTLPVIGVPVQSKALNGMDSLLSIVQMPAGIPVATVAIGRSGAVNAGLLAAQFLSAFDPSLKERLDDYRHALEQKVKESDLD